ncbi:hypothetical protein Cs7R123_63050 [Catellatospora sp. TT07R-123]|uniref:hypothetical protein n=1 Tax=Catellatospora sp. TT07R-123 TaxID=2733863 RepID=UPI001B0BA997|nr:hypothetical protein [Catellatospora sp. TT07R-123]GHJ48963.1 hypothetical protein Cs7R123_63050 [Catellatospora sp. TT07R-123]
MNFFQRLARRLGQAFAVFRDPDGGLLRPLPEPAVDPRVDAGRLADAAREQGRSDGRRYLFDGWSFGHEDDPADAILDPEYVLGLRHQCRTAVHEHRDRQRLTDARLADLHLLVWDEERNMRAARDRMARIAARGERDEEDSLRAFFHRRDIDVDALQLPELSHPVWEGEAPPMRLFWRILIVLFLGVVVFEIERYVASSFLPVTDLGSTAAVTMTAAIAGLTVLGPLVAGQLFRHRHATGHDRVLTALTFLLLLPSLAIILGFGLLAARLFDQGTPVTPGAGASSLGLTAGTLVVVFDVVLFLACTMAYVLGMAQRHPFQQAFARSRRVRDRTLLLSQRMGTRINGDYRALATDLGDQQGAPTDAVDREAAIRHAYLAAEDAYYQGLIEAVADPTFTEAVMRRRNRPALPPDVLPPDVLPPPLPELVAVPPVESAAELVPVEPGRSPGDE